MSTFLELRNIELAYGNILALKGISLSVEKGDVVSLIGANGAGKSTLLKAIAGIRPVAAGEIVFNGETIIKAEPKSKRLFSKSASLGADKIVARGISLVPEGRSVFVRVHAPLRGLTTGGITMIVFDAAQRAGLPKMHAHRLRHTAATAMLRAGSPLPEVGQVLRHRSVLSTAIYAKVDRDALRALARPWPSIVEDGVS